MTLIAPTGDTPPSTGLPPVTCASWCIDGTGHTDAPFPEDQVCRGTTVDVELTRRPLVEVAEDQWARETVHLYLRRNPGSHTPTVEVYRGELGESVTFTLDEAEALGMALVRSVLEARSAR
ncbi:hypothetical protein L2K70_13450 [Nocardioides KLBMP 9356]|uniref:Uncharacterized protein n=1 Tax=Nocardioides potassii TaxID=2911371 RepID=A0ABS9HE64_9ACTN|nr:hypothetical protein [Nocardioides potassii]MCF6378612.1 hypothetical protein [Nocardioides potassii]